MGHHLFLLIDFVFDSLSENKIGDKGATALVQQLYHLVNYSSKK